VDFGGGLFVFIPITQLLNCLLRLLLLVTGNADEATQDRSLVTERCPDAERIYSVKICRELASYKFRFLTRFSGR